MYLHYYSNWTIREDKLVRAQVFVNKSPFLIFLTDDKNNWKGTTQSFLFLSNKSNHFSHKNPDISKKLVLFLPVNIISLWNHWCQNLCLQVQGHQVENCLRCHNLQLNVCHWLYHNVIKEILPCGVWFNSIMMFGSVPCLRSSLEVWWSVNE